MKTVRKQAQCTAMEAIRIELSAILNGQKSTFVMSDSPAIHHDLAPIVEEFRRAVQKASLVNSWQDVIDMCTTTLSMIEKAPVHRDKDLIQIEVQREKAFALRNLSCLTQAIEALKTAELLAKTVNLSRYDLSSIYCELAITYAIALEFENASEAISMLVGQENSIDSIYVLATFLWTFYDQVEDPIASEATMKRAWQRIAQRKRI